MNLTRNGIRTRDATKRIFLVVITPPDVVLGREIGRVAAVNTARVTVELNKDL